ncbi:hypothetical protein RNJ44_01522 [Nakaseomyces bracarensis]|uniref:CHCH domain-containing protein n=1 Tax=Nakaseomyces bracarensis TaxID=273131 RepID=A0ABR4NQ22_9SACH
MSENKSKSKYYEEALEQYKEMVEEEEEDGSERDSWDKRITDTGCYVENLALQLCHAETNDWRQCFPEMAQFRSCWEKNGNRDRVQTVDRDLK